MPSPPVPRPPLSPPPVSLRHRLAVLATLTLLVAGRAPAQTGGGGAAAPSAAPSVPSPAVRAADPADVGSIDAIITALYESISGPKGAPRDFDRLRTLFGPGARMIPALTSREGRPTLRNWSVEEYIAAAGPGLMANGFFEREIGRSTTSFGNVWHVWSTYDSRFTPESAPFQRGINSIQLFRGTERWYILTVMWDSEREGNPSGPERLTTRP